MAGFSHQFDEILGRLKSEGGFTYDPRTGTFPTSGYSVAAHPAAEMVSEHPAGVTREHLEGFIAGSAPVWKQDRGGSKGREMIGGWGNTLDLPKLYPATPAGHQKSREAQILREQKASFSLHDMAEEPNPWSPRQPDEGEHPDIGRMMRGKFPEFEHMVRTNPSLALQQPEIKAWAESPQLRAHFERDRQRRQQAQE
jgi:hypothetical protein